MILWVHTQEKQDLRQKPVYILHYGCDAVASKDLTDLIRMLINSKDTILILINTEGESCWYPLEGISDCLHRNSPLSSSFKTKNSPLRNVASRSRAPGCQTLTAPLLCAQCLAGFKLQGARYTSVLPVLKKLMMIP